jgi:uncharacterized protein (TIGR03086 family)
VADAAVDTVDLLESVLDKTAGVVDGVPADAGTRPTPCPSYDVAALVDHIVTWMGIFAESATRDDPDAGPAPVEAGPESDRVRAAAGRAVAAFRRGATERTLTVSQGELPGRAVAGMMLIEYIGHGWDLATATGQPVPYSDDEAAAALRVAQAMLTPEFRGEGKPFGEEVPVPENADAVTRLLGFIGRDPSWRAAG